MITHHTERSSINTRSMSVCAKSSPMNRVEVKIHVRKGQGNRTTIDARRARFLPNPKSHRWEGQGTVGRQKGHRALERERLSPSSSSGWTRDVGEGVLRPAIVHENHNRDVRRSRENQGNASLKIGAARPSERQTFTCTNGSPSRDPLGPRIRGAIALPRRPGEGLGAWAE